MWMVFIISTATSATVCRWDFKRNMRAWVQEAGIIKTNSWLMMLVECAVKYHSHSYLGPDIRFDMFQPKSWISVWRRHQLQQNRNTRAITYASRIPFYILIMHRLTGGCRKAFFSTDFDYTINSQRAAGYNVKVPLWNASPEQPVLKFNRGELKFSARDLLNKNVGISRNTNNNYIEDSRVLASPLLHWVYLSLKQRLGWIMEGVWE